MGVTTIGRLAFDPGPLEVVKKRNADGVVLYSCFHKALGRIGWVLLLCER